MSPSFHSSDTRGADLAKFTQNSWPWVNVIVTTGFAELILEGVPHNVKFVPKPWRPDDMMNHSATRLACLRAPKPLAVFGKAFSAFAQRNI